MNRKMLWYLLALGVMLIGLASVYTPASARPLALPPRPTPTVVPTAVPTAVPTIVPPVRSLSPAVEGGAIVLHVTAPPAGLWATVEWQDAAGNWHPVEGWQGTLDADQTKTWWVAKADLGTGPFRWVGYERYGGQRWAHSLSFYLPAINRQKVEVALTGPSR